MRKRLMTITTAFLLTAGSGLAFDPPGNGRGPQNAPQTQGQQQMEHRGRQGNGNMEQARRKTGPQDGSGPIHNPGTGRGRGGGQRAGRR